ncbi:MAG: AzlC family ABC transporter permease [Desulfovibrionaceae bacterium]|nr:AzlC family ABC transporter permease [Desulfovibrionaceae bacterium]
MPNPHAHILEGIRRALPILLGYLPVGFAFGVLAVKNGISGELAIVMSLLMYSGTGQLICAGMWGQGSSVLSIVAAVAIVNLRYLLLSAAQAPWMNGLPRIQRFLLGMGLTDETFAVHITAFLHGWQRNLTTLFVTNHVAQIGWVGGTVLGAFCGDLIQDIRPFGLDYALTAMFLALLVLQCISPLHTCIAVITLLLSVTLKVCGMTQWNIAVATIVGASIGAILLTRKENHDN